MSVCACVRSSQKHLHPVVVFLFAADTAQEISHPFVTLQQSTGYLATAGYRMEESFSTLKTFHHPHARGL